MIKKEEQEEPEGSKRKHRSSEAPQPTASDWKHTALTATANGLDLAAGILHATGHDSLGLWAKTAAHVLRLVALLRRPTR